MNISQVLTKLKALIYSKSETDSLLGGKANSSHTHTKSQITDFPTIPSKVSQLTNDSGFITSSGSCNYANSAGSASSATTATTAGAVRTVVDNGSTKDLVCATMANNDYCRISCGGSDDDGYLEIATGDGASEPIYVRQYPWESNSSPRTLTLLDGSGNTQFPGTVTAPTFSGNLNGNCDYAKLLAYSHTNEINFKGGRQATCYFNYRNADDDSIGTAATVEYKFCNYGGNSVSNVTVSAGTFNENGSSLADKYQAKGSYASSSHTHTKSQITDFPTIPSKTSQLTNDSGFLTSHQSLDGRVAKAGDTMTGTLKFSTENNVCLNLRPSNASWYDTISVQTEGNEAVVFATANAVTSWMFINGEDSTTNHAQNRWQSLTPGLQIKSNKVAIGKLIANGANLTYPLEVNGTMSASSVVVTNNSSNGVIFGSYRVYVG